MITYPVTSIEIEKNKVSSACSLNIDESELNELWKKISEGDFDSFEVLHCFFYPALLNYARLILQDESIADSVIAEIFVNLWYDREKVSGSELKRALVTGTRKMIFSDLANVSGGNVFLSLDKQSMPVVNGYFCRESEIRFLIDNFKFDEKLVFSVIES